MSASNANVLWVNLEAAEHQMVHQFAEQKKLGEQGFSAALRSMVREWALMQQGFNLAQVPFETGWAELLNRQENGRAAPGKSYISRLVNLETAEHQIVLKHAYESGYGEKNFSQALRSILQQWSWMRQACGKTRGKEATLYAKLGQTVYQGITAQDRLLECGSVELEIPSDSSEPGDLRIPRLPEDEEEAKLMSQKLNRILMRY
jgi:hypothetical protein